MRLTAALVFVPFLALAACDRGAKTEPAAPAPVDVREVAAADGYGSASEKVRAAAFWSHPSVNFQSLIIAASDQGLNAYNIETGELAAFVKAPAEDIKITYIGAGPSAVAYAITRNGKAYEVYSIANDATALSPLASTGGEAGADAYCVSGGVLYEAGANKLVARDISILTGGVVIGDAREIASLPGAAACHVDDRTGDVITISNDGAIKRIDPKTGESFGLAFVTGPGPGPSALFLMMTPEPENANGGAIAVLDEESGVISLFDLIDGHALGAVRIKATFDLDAVASATTIAAGYGNYGSVYRDGVLAVVTAGGGAPIRLAPWNGVLAAFNLTLGENVDPRSPQVEDLNERVIDIEFKQP